MKGLGAIGPEAACNLSQTLARPWATKCWGVAGAGEPEAECTCGGEGEAEGFQFFFMPHAEHLFLGAQLVTAQLLHFQLDCPWDDPFAGVHAHEPPLGCGCCGIAQFQFHDWP